MSEPEEKLNFLEIIGVVILLFGLCFGMFVWWLGETFWDSALMVFGFFIISGLLILVGEGLKTGKLELRGGSVNRDKNPLIYWGCSLFYVGVALVLLTGFVLAILGGG